MMAGVPDEIEVGPGTKLHSQAGKVHVLAIFTGKLLVEEYRPHDFQSANTCYRFDYK
jgi:hypothetical protein